MLMPREHIGQIFLVRDKGLKTLSSCDSPKVIQPDTDKILRENPGLPNSGPRLPPLYQTAFLLLQGLQLPNPINMNYWNVTVISEKNERTPRFFKLSSNVKAERCDLKKKKQKLQNLLKRKKIQKIEKKNTREKNSPQPLPQKKTFTKISFQLFLVPWAVFELLPKLLLT